MLASQQTNDERSESRADTPQLAAGSFIKYYILYHSFLVGQHLLISALKELVVVIDGVWSSASGRASKPVTATSPGTLNPCSAR